VGYPFKYLPTARFLPTIFLSALLALIPACRKASYRTDISGVDLEIKIQRLEKDLFAIDFDSIPQNIPRLYDRYGDFFDLFNYRVINLGNPRQPAYPDYLKSFLTDYLNNQVYMETMKVFPELTDLEKMLTDAFKRYRYHFPEKSVPAVYSFISRFNQSIVTADSILGIGLDNYLGTDCEYYKRLNIQHYQVLNKYPAKIPSDCMLGWAMTEFEFNDSVDNVLSNMIYQGKIACFAKWMLPLEADSVIMGFTADQMKFCRNNEAQMWEYLVEHKILFESGRMDIQRFTGIGPFTKDFTHESPARAAVWIGWRIVEEYLRRNPKITLGSLMKEDDYQRILTLSGYNP